MRTRRSPSSSDPVSEGHRPVLLHEAIEALGVRADSVVVDATLGGAGHAHALCEALGREGVFVGFDLDPDAVARAEAKLADARPKKLLINANFRNLKKELAARSIARIDRALFDLGWSSYQLVAGRGFSFQSNEPLLMTYGNPQTGGAALTAAAIVNEWGENSIADVLYGWGEERYARRIAKAIVAARAEGPIATARELADIVRAAVPPAYRRGKLHPATKTFQALRIAVNDELGALTEGLSDARELLAPEGRVAVITFHSLEDRLVKRAFVEWEKRGYGRRLTKKPVAASGAETAINPRARSAKLRVFQTL